MDEILTFVEQRRVKQKLQNLDLEKIKESKHLYKNKKTGKADRLNPRHGISWEDIKAIVKDIKRITEIRKRNGVGGTRYTIVYKMGQKKSIFAIFLLDEKPPIIFDIYPRSRKDPKRMNRRYKGYYFS